MKNSKYHFAFVALFILSNLFGQNLKEYDQSIIKIETADKSQIKTGDGYFFVFNLTKNNLSYSAIVVKKTIIENSTEIKLFLKKVNDKIPYIFTVKNNNENVIQVSDENNEFVLIPFGYIHSKLKEKNIQTEEILLTEDFIKKLNLPIKESDIQSLKQIWETRINRSASYNSR